MLYLFFQELVCDLSVLLRGTTEEKLNWAFNLYDINKDGQITKEVWKHFNLSRLCLNYILNFDSCQKNVFVLWSMEYTDCIWSFFQEMLDILKSIYDLMGKSIHPRLKEEAVRQHIRMFFQVMPLCTIIFRKSDYAYIFWKICRTYHFALYYIEVFRQKCPQGGARSTMTFSPIWICHLKFTLVQSLTLMSSKPVWLSVFCGTWSKMFWEMF